KPFTSFLADCRGESIAWAIWPYWSDLRTTSTRLTPRRCAPSMASLSPCRWRPEPPHAFFDEPRSSSTPAGRYTRSMAPQQLTELAQQLLAGQCSAEMFIKLVVRSQDEQARPQAATVDVDRAARCGFPE